MAKTRLDQLLVERHLAPSRERARALILSGHVTVGGQVVAKAGAAVSLDAQVQLAVPDHPYVGRGGLKLAHALDVFRIDVAGRRALDIGASTGGFTDVLLQRGAGSVIALDVGRGQLDWSLRNDPRVTVREGVNARALGREHIPHEVDLVTICEPISVSVGVARIRPKLEFLEIGEPIAVGVPARASRRQASSVEHRDQKRRERFIRLGIRPPI